MESNRLWLTVQSLRVVRFFSGIYYCFWFIFVYIDYRHFVLKMSALIWLFLLLLGLLFKSFTLVSFSFTFNHQIYFLFSAICSCLYSRKLLTSLQQFTFMCLFTHALYFIDKSPSCQTVKISANSYLNLLRSSYKTAYCKLLCMLKEVFLWIFFVCL